MGKFHRTFVLLIIIFLFNAHFNFLFSQANLFDTKKKFFENGQPTPRGIDVGMFADTPVRLKVDLSGNWLYNYRDEEWKNVVVPSAYAYEEKVTFQRKFEITADMLDRYNFSLVVYGINYQSEININGNFVGRHMGGYTSFTLPIRENVLLVGHENVIKVTVNNFLTVNTTLPLRQQVGGWRNYGGIFRDIYLLATPKIFISDLYLKSEKSSDYKNVKINLKTTIENVGFNLTDTEKSKNAFTAFSVEVYEKLSDALVGRSAIIPFEVAIKKQKEINVDIPLSNPKLWSPDFPDLYIIKCNIIRVEGKETFPIDEYVLNYGIHDVKFKGSTILFNNTPLQIKGVLWCEDHPFFGSAMTYEAMEKDVAMIKTTGANLIRFLHPPHPYMLNLCDRYGILAMQEIPVTQVPAEILDKEFYTDLAQTYAKEMVFRDRNHPSVLAWGIGSDIEFSRKSLSVTSKYVESLRKTILNLDDRPIYLSVPSGFIRVDFYKEILDKVDITSISTFAGVDGSISKFREELTFWKENYRDKALIVGKYGKEIKPTNRNGYSDPFSLEAQARYAWQAFEVIKELKLVGGVLWSFNDWHTERPSLSTPSGDPYLMTMGIVSYDRERRVVYDVIRNVFNNEKVSALPVGNYSSSAPVIYVLVGLFVLISLAFFYNSNRRFRENINRSLTRNYNFFADVRDQRIIPISHSVLLCLLFSITLAIISSSIISHYRYNVLADNILSQFLSDTIKEWMITLVWQPIIYILYFSVIIFVLIMFLALIVKFFSLFIRVKVYLYHAFSITIWSLVPMIILIPLSMILFRIMESPVYILPAIGLILLVKIWSLYRLFKGISIIYDVNPGKIYGIGIILILVISGIIYGYFDYSHSTSIYLKYLFEANTLIW